jgi:hypothetical protein
VKEAKEKLHPDSAVPLSQVEHHSIPNLHVLEFHVAFVPHSKAWNIKDMMPKTRLGKRHGRANILKNGDLETCEPDAHALPAITISEALEARSPSPSPGVCDVG